MMYGVIDDLRLAIRKYHKAALSSSAAMFVLAIALGFTMALLAMFSDLVLKHNPGLERGGLLVTLGAFDGSQLHKLDVKTIMRLDTSLSSMDAVAGVRIDNQSLVDHGSRQTLTTELVTELFFSQLHPAIYQGRGLLPRDHIQGIELVAVISYQFWKRRFNGNADALGQYIELYGPQISFTGPSGIQTLSDRMLRYRVVGIMAPEMQGTFTRHTDVWLPFAPASAGLANGHQYAIDSLSKLHAVGRIDKGYTIRQVNSELDAINWVGDSGDSKASINKSGIRAVPGLISDYKIFQSTLNQIQVLILTSLMVLLVAAVNTGIFLLSFIPDRRQELVIRTILGARVARLIRQLFTESAIFVVTAACLGFFLGFLSINIIRRLAILQLAPWKNVAVIDWYTGVLMLLLTLLTSVIIAIISILGIKFSNLINDSSRMTRNSKLSRLIAASSQLAVACISAFIASAVGWHLHDLYSIQSGLSTSGRIAVVLAPDNDIEKAFSVSNNDITLLREQRRHIVDSFVGVTHVAFGTPLPFTRQNKGLSVSITIPSQIDPENGVMTELVSADSEYYKILGLELISGRFPLPNEFGVAIVNEEFAKLYYGKSDIIGKSINAPGILNDVQIVGVSVNTRFGYPADDPKPRIFSPRTPSSLSDAMLIRGEITPFALQNKLSSAIADGDLDMAITYVQSLDNLQDALLAADRSRFQVTGIAALLVIAISVLGFFGIQHYQVHAALKEYAIRSAIGENPASLLWSVMGHGTLLAIPGLAVGGVFGGIIVTRLQHGGILSDAISVTSIGVLVSLSLLLLIVLTTLGPARTAANCDPARILREG